jgi:hypothetical protein
MTTTDTRPRVTCSECGGSYLPTKDGTVRAHREKRPHRNALHTHMYCRGGGKSPAEETP